MDVSLDQETFLLTWINFNTTMDKRGLGDWLYQPTFLEITFS